MALQSDLDQTDHWQKRNQIPTPTDWSVGSSSTQCNCERSYCRNEDKRKRRLVSRSLACMWIENGQSRRPNHLSDVYDIANQRVANPSHKWQLVAVIDRGFLDNQRRSARYGGKKQKWELFEKRSLCQRPPS